MNLSQFKIFVISLIRSIIAKGDERAAADAATIAKVSADAAELSATVEQLKVALAESQDSGAKALVNQAADQAAGLDSLTTELQETFNPTPVADAVAETVQQSPEVTTPPEVTAADTIGEAEPTAITVVEAAIGAIADAPAE
jgi:hypothetical protein